MNVTKTKAHIACLCLTFPLAWQLPQAAEIVGSVSVDYQGLFESQAGGQVHPVSVALLPAQNQPVPRRGALRHRIEIVDNRMRPAFITVQSGDRVEFLNRDSVFHELFSLSSADSVNQRLGKADSGETIKAEFVLDQVGTTHFFCRIHNKAYARIDVVDTPYLQMIAPGARFHFVDLATGQWKLRLASPAAETRWVDVTAMTTPPSLQLSLTSRGGSGAVFRDRVPKTGVRDLFTPVDTHEAGR